MTFTLVPVTRTYTDGSGNPRSGTVRLQLVGVLTNSGEIADRRPYTATLDSLGKISLSVQATNDPDTLPVGGGTYEVTETLSGLATATYFIAVPYDGGTVDLATAPRLAEALAPGIFFQPVNTRGLPNGYAGLDGSGRVPLDQLPANLGTGGGSATPISGDNTDIQALGTRAAGASGKAADAQHVHQMPLLHQVGLPTASIPLNGQRITGAADGVNPQDYATVAQLGGSALAWYNVKDKLYGAKGDGATDDRAAIQAAIDACPSGGIVYFPAGVYRTSATLKPKPGVVLQGVHASLMSGPGLTDPPSYIQPLASFTGTALLTYQDQTTGGYSSLAAEHRLQDIMLDGSTLDGTKPVDGIYAAGNVQNLVMRNVTIRKMSNNGIVTAGVSNVFPYSWRLHSVMVDNCRGNGMLLNRMTDITLDDCQVIGCWATGFILNNIANSTLLGCRSEWNGNYGYYITGSWGNGAGSGGAVMSACSTDRNGWDGVRVDATGNGPLTIGELVTRRDGRNGGSGGANYAGLSLVGSTMPVVVSGLTCYPGVDDNGSGTNSPQYGVRLSGASNVQLDIAYLHADAQGLYDDGTNTAVTIGATVTTATGPTTAPVRATRPSLAVDWLNVKKYNAKGDGVTDDAPAIQAAINAASAAGGGTLYFPAGRYILNAALTWASGVNAIGAGARVSILQSTNQTLDCITGTDISGVTLQALQLSGPGRGYGSGVRFTRFSAPSTANISLRDMLIQSFGGDGVFCHELASSTLHRVRVRTCGGLGFHLRSPQDTVLGGTSTSLISCSAEGNVTGGFWLDGMAYTTLNACSASNTPAGYRLDNCLAVNITGSGAEQCTTGLIIYGGNGTVVNGFYTEASDGTSVWLTNATSGAILSGIVEASPGSGATTCLRADAGTYGTALGLIAVKPNALNGTVNLLGQGDGSVTLAGRTVVPATGTGARMGTVVLVGGTATVNTTAIGAGSVVMLTTQAPGGTVGTPYVSARTAGTSFAVTSTSASDTSTVGWRILDPS
jgi:hypothetical protein